MDVHSQAEAPVNERGGQRSLLLLDAREGADASITRILAPAGTRQPEHRHVGAQQLYVILAGTGAMRVGDETRAVGPGDAVVVPSGTVHAIEGTSTSPALDVLTVTVPPFDASALGATFAYVPADDAPAATRPVFAAAARAALRLVAHPEAAARWEEPSALPRWSVGGLAGHLVRAILTVDGYLRGAPAHASGDVEPLDAAGYYLAALPDPVVRLESDLHRSIRARGEEAATDGPSALVARASAVLGDVEALLEEVGGRRLVAGLGGLRITVEDYLVTRVVELVVHADDLAASLGVAPELPAAAVALAAGTALEVARRRHGDLTVLRAVTRRERLPAGAALAV